MPQSDSSGPAATELRACRGGGEQSWRIQMVEKRQSVQIAAIDTGHRHLLIADTPIRLSAAPAA
jgi:hypothetical protein